jgi:hypothetical protein
MQDIDDQDVVEGPTITIQNVQDLIDELAEPSESKEESNEPELPN